MSKDILDASALLSTLPILIPDNTVLSSPQDALAALLHTIMSALSFRLIALDDSVATNEYSGNKLSDQWNRQSPSQFTFRYRHEQSSLEFLLKLTKLGDRTLLNGIATGVERTATVDIKTADYTSASFYPHKCGSSTPLVHGFISSNRVSDLVNLIKLKVISTLMPGLNKDGYQEREATGVESSTSRSVEPEHPRAQRPDPEGQGIPTGNRTFPPERIPPIGRRDLDPIPLNPFAPPSLFPTHGGDGMFVGPEHPIFDRRRRDPLGGGFRGPWGGDGYLPPMGAPPGARFDPILPDADSGPGGRFGLPGRGARARGADPDNDEFMPPGAGDMFM